MARTVVRIAGVCGGEPTIEGTRLTCANVVLDLAFRSLDADTFLETWSYLTKEDVRACVEFCADQKCLVDNRVKYCSRCSLDTSPPPAPPVAFVDSIAGAAKHEDGQVFLGTREEYEDDARPRDIWKIADDLRKRLWPR